MLKVSLHWVEVAGMLKALKWRPCLLQVSINWLEIARMLRVPYTVNLWPCLLQVSLNWVMAEADFTNDGVMIPVTSTVLSYIFPLIDIA